jgi:hypothetical protein
MPNILESLVFFCFSTLLTFLSFKHQDWLLDHFIPFYNHILSFDQLDSHSLLNLFNHISK